MEVQGLHLNTVGTQLRRATLDMLSMQSKDEIAELVLKTMHRRDITIKELAGRTKLSRFKVGRFLANQHPLDSREVAVVLRALGLQIEDRSNAQRPSRAGPPPSPDR